MAVDPLTTEPLLAAFLSAVRRLNLDPATTPSVLSISVGDGLIGSDVGREFWSSDEASKLLDYLLTDPLLKEWFSPPPDSATYELKRMLTSVVRRWLASGQNAETFAATKIEEVLQALREPSAIAGGFALAHGVTADSRIELPFGLAAEPVSAEQLETLPVRFPISSLEVMRFPKGPALALRTRNIASRDEFTAIAATHAASIARNDLEDLRIAIWLATGTVPGRGDVFIWHESAWPAQPTQHIPVFAGERFADVSEDEPQTLIDSTFLQSIVSRLGVIGGVAEDLLDEETYQTLWTAHSLLESVLYSPDPVIVLLLSYAALDGLLLNREDDDTQLGRRVAWLVGISADDRRLIGRLVNGLRDLRGTIAHGRRPLIQAVTAVLGDDVTVSGASLASFFAAQRVRRSLRWRCLDLLRRAFLAVLWLTIDVDSESAGPTNPRIQARVSRADMLTYLVQAGRNDLAAQRFLGEAVPLPVRRGIPPPLPTG